MDLSSFLRKEEVAALAGVSTRTIERLLVRGACPLPIRFGVSSAWDEAAVRAWLKTYKPDTRGRSRKRRIADRVAVG
jgi:predicted DNA-binding transcriptional regulator AlpA